MIETIMQQYVFYFNIVVAVYLTIYIMILLAGTVYGAFDILHEAKLESMHNVLEHDFYYPISILIPMYNEGVTGIQTVENVLKQDYKLFEIIIIDDGSQDNTKQLMIDHFRLEPEYDRPIRYLVPCKKIQEVYSGRYEGREIILISKLNGGCKADAANAGINISNYPYILNMDGDEILQRDALKRVAREIIKDDTTIGVGGNLRISNNVSFVDAYPKNLRAGRNLLADIQSLEYSRNFAGAKILHNRWNANLIISGGYGVFKKSALLEVGGYDPKSLGEDFEMTLRLHRHFMKEKKKYVMKYVEDSVCWTQAPSTYKDLRKQRRRWHCGLIQTLYKYRGMIFNPRYGVIGMVTLPNHIFYELLAPTMMLLGWVAIIFSILLDTVNFPFVLIVYLIYVLFSILLTMLSHIGNCYRKQEKVTAWALVRIFLLGLYEAFIYKIYLTLVEFFAGFQYKKVASKWESPTRVDIKA